MPRLFAPAQIAEARARVTANGRSIAEWSAENNFDYQITCLVLRGHSPATRGESYRIAQALGLRKAQAKKRSAAKPTQQVAA